MNQLVTDFLSKLELGEPQRCENLAMIPLIQSGSQPLDYVTLEDGLENDLLAVEELEERASVNDIQFHNKSKLYALLFEGEEFLGAMQNRILNVSVLVKPETRQRLPVSCVEHGRWHHEHRERENQKFRVAKDRVHYARGRAMENRAVNESLRTRSEFRGDQREVWQDIELKSQRLQAESPTSASEEMYASNRMRAQRYVESFVHEQRQVGSVFLVDGKVSGVDLFASESTHKSMLTRVVRSYSLDALDSVESRNISDSNQENEAATTRAAAKQFVERLMNAATIQYDGLAEGQNIRFEQDGLTGSALVFQDQVLHLSAFNL